MRIRTNGAWLIAIIIGGTSPALADCCSSVFDCAATVVTDGLSCEIETLISTIKTLTTVIKNLGDDVTGKTQSAEQAARQYVSDQISTMQSTSQQNASDLGSAQTQADDIFRQETAPTVSATLASGHSQSDVQAPSQTPASAPPAASGPPLTERSARQGTNGPVLANGSVAVSERVGGGTETVVAPRGQYGDAFDRGLKRIIALKGVGDVDLSQVNQFLAKAQQTEGPGVAAANTLAGALTSPITDMTSELESLLANPLQAYDPSARVQSIEDSIESHLNVDIQTMIDDITAGPNQQFTAAMPAYTDLSGNAAGAKAIAAAMNRLYRQRSPAAAEALYALLPKQNYAALTSKAAVTGTLNAANSGNLSTDVIKSKISAVKQNAMLVARLPNFDVLHAAVARFKVQRAQADAIRTPSMVQAYRNSLAQQLDGLFAGKAPPAIAAQRDQLIAQARVRFAQDPSTANGVIGLISAEAQKRGAQNAFVPSQPTPASTQTAAKANSPGAAAPAQPTAATWGSARAWSPHGSGSVTGAVTGATTAAPPVVTAFKPTTALKTVQPVQKLFLKPGSAATAPTAPTTP